MPNRRTDVPVNQILGSTGDLMSIIKSSVPSTSQSKCITVGAVPAGVNNGWAKRESGINTTTLRCNDNNKKFNTDPKGWRVIDDQKTYTTFRNGQLVRATGFAGEQLSCGDGKKNKSSTEGKENNNQIKVSKKRKSSDSIQDVSKHKTGESSRTIQDCFQPKS